MKKRILIYGDNHEKMRGFAERARNTKDGHRVLLRSASFYQNDRSAADEVYIVEGSKNEDAIRAAYPKLHVQYVPDDLGVEMFAGDEPAIPPKEEPIIIQREDDELENMTVEQLRDYITTHGAARGMRAHPRASKQTLFVQASSLKHQVEKTDSEDD